MSQFARLKPKTTPNQARASAGKRRRQAARKAAYEDLAATLGVTVAQVKMIEARESATASALRQAEVRAQADLNRARYPRPAWRPY